MKYFLNIVLLLLIVCACFADEVYLYLRPPQVGSAVAVTLRSDLSFDFDQEKALGTKRQRALAEYVTLYTHAATQSAAAAKRLETLIARVADFRTQKKIGEATFWGYLKREFGIDFGRREIERLYRYKNLDSLMEVVLTIRESIQQNNIIATRDRLNGKERIDIYYPDTAQTRSVVIDQVMTLEDAQRYLETKAPQLLWNVPKDILEPVLRLFSHSLVPNLRYDENENNRRIEAIIAKYPKNIVAYAPGDVLVPFGTVVDDETAALLDRYRAIRHRDIIEHIAWLLFFIVAVVVVYNIVLSQGFLTGRRKELTHRYHLTLLITTVVLSAACLLIVPFPIYVLPFAALPLILLLLNQERTAAVATTLMGALLVSLYAGISPVLFVFFALGGMAALFSTGAVRKRTQILLSALVVGVVNVATVAFASFDGGSIAALFGQTGQTTVAALSEMFSAPTRHTMAWALAGGVVAGPLALLFLPLFELLWNDVPNFKLHKYSDLQKPILRELLEKAPGTYQHTMMVATLAQAVGEAVGANTLLLRIGAYYHDIGKIENAALFAENQFKTKNGHENMKPRESAKVIINHIKGGKKLARAIGLPQRVIDLIMQHHGTQLVEYFYCKAAKDNQGVSPRKEYYRYPGPKPQSIEAAILMIVDAAEAASRSVKEPKREDIERIVRVIIEKRIADGQFDECDICMRDLGTISRALIEAMEAQFHSRVMYPWQEEEN